jgi:hypothetical protein
METELSDQPAPDDPSRHADGDTVLAERHRQALIAATRWLPGMSLPLTYAALEELAVEARDLWPEVGWDRYGEHGPVAQVEKQVSELLGKPAAAMFPSGIMAQQSVLRTWTDRRRSHRVAAPRRWIRTPNLGRVGGTFPGVS